MNTAFHNHMTTFAEEKGFVWNSQSAAWATAICRFNFYSEAYQEAMPYSFFKENVLGEMSPAVSCIINPLHIQNVAA